MKLIERNKCTGCMACLQACPKHCIKVVEDELGNLHPSIDSSTCIQCMRCKMVCPEMNINSLIFNSSKKAYAVWSLDEQTRFSSASGGLAAELYRFAIAHNYWICGVEYANDFHVIHTITNNVDTVIKYQQSKYVYSESTEIYLEVKKKLENNEKVLFISLPCKVAGLKAFLEKDYSQLITVDIVCHGTPPYRQMIDHVKNVDKRRCAKKLSFRVDNDFIFQLKEKNNIVYKKSVADDEYLSAFLNGLNYRESCYQCLYARPERIGDLTISDFWGLGEKIPFNHTYSGSVSAVLINTLKGDNFFSNAKENLFSEERPIDEVIEGNSQLRYPSKRHTDHDLFIEQYPIIGFEKSVRKCLKHEMKTAKVKQIKIQGKNLLKTVASYILPHYRN